MRVMHLFSLTKRILLGLTTIAFLLLSYVLATGEWDMVVDKTVRTEGGILSGDSIEYSISLHNFIIASTGYHATGVRVEDALPSGMTFTGTWTGTSSAVNLISAIGVSPIVWEIPHFFAGDGITILYSVQVSTTGNLINTVEVIAPVGAPPESDTGNNIDSQQITVIGGLIDGVCGSKDGGIYYGSGGLNAATGTLCDAGIHDTPDYEPGTGWNWECVSTNGGSDDLCSATELYCGDGVMQPDKGEVCDDSNGNSGDGCDDTCTAIESGYTCSIPGSPCDDIDECTLGMDNCSDDAACSNLTGSFSCTCNTGFTGDGVTCSVVCGDSILLTGAGEECDDGGLVNGDGCDDSCLFEIPSCALDITPGTGLAPLSVTGTVLSSGWVDLLSLDRKDGMITSSPVFPTTHTYTMTGSFLVSLEIQNNLSGSSLTGVCTDLVEVNVECGNGITEIGEQCDDGVSNGVACSPGYETTCTYCSNTCQDIIVQGSFCGDETIDGTEGEQCDDGVNNGIPCTPGYGGITCTYCSADCSSSLTLTGGVCGDSIQQGPETCDDGNLDSGDGCSSTCSSEHPSGGSSHSVGISDGIVFQTQSISGDIEEEVLTGTISGTGLMLTGAISDDVQADAEESDEEKESFHRSIFAMIRARNISLRDMIKARNASLLTPVIYMKKTYAFIGVPLKTKAEQTKKVGPKQLENLEGVPVQRVDSAQIKKEKIIAILKKYEAGKEE